MLIAIENTVCLNAGDAAILLALIQEMKRVFGEETRFVVFDADPEIASRYFPGIEFRPQTSSLLTVPRLPAKIFGRSWAIRLRRNAERVLRAEFRRVVRAAGRSGGEAQSLLLGAALKENIDLYRQANLIISTGGTYLVEHYDLDGKLIEFEKDMALGKQLVLFTQSMGPFANPRNRERLRKVLDYAAVTLVREERSYGHIRDLGVAGQNLAIAADSVFVLAEPEVMAKAALPRGPVAPRQVAISVREWAHFTGRGPEEGMAAYESAIGQAVISLVEQHGTEIKFVSTCQGIKEYRYDDSIVAKRIVARLPESVRSFVSVDDRFHTPDALMRLIAGFDFVISTRMHMAILALCAGVPVLPVAYEFKTTELFASLGQGRWVTDIETIDAPAFDAMVGQFVAGLDVYRAEVFPEVSALSVSARSAGEMIGAAIERRIAVPS